MSTFKKSVTAFAVAAALGVAAPAFADNSAGSIYGHAKQGQTVSIKNLSTGFKREVVAEDGGRFNFSQLPVGKYEVTNGTETYQITVAIGTGTAVEFGLDAERIEVRGARISAIDTSSVESTTVFTQEQLQLLPVDRDVTNVALLAPGTTKGDDGFGNLASFGGASVAENGYYINGFDVTNIRTFLSFADLPFDAIAQQQVKTGGYGAEYGRALGGVINIVTKSGSNDFEFGGAVYWSPENLREPYRSQVTKDRTQDIDHLYHVYNHDNTRSDLAYNVWASGPIIEDTLFFYAMVEGRDNEFNDYNRSGSDVSSETDPQYMLKLDWNITDDHIVEFTAIHNEMNTDYITYTNNTDGDGNIDDFYTGEHQVPFTKYSLVNGGDVFIAKYTGHITDDLTISALYGQLDNKINFRDNYSVFPGRVSPTDCPRVYDSRDGGIAYAGCFDPNQLTVKSDLTKPDTDEREAFRVDLEYVVGDHTIRAGYDHELYTSTFIGSAYTGGIYYRYFTVGASGTVNGVSGLTPGDTYVRTWDRGSESGSFEVENTAAYIEDTWQVTDNVMLYLGLRNETFTNRNDAGEVFIEADSLIAPRLGFAWDVDGDSSKKVFANVGRYYIPVASNSNIRAAGIERFDVKYFQYEGIDPVTWAPVTLGDQIGPTNVNGAAEAPNSATIADQKLNPMYQDEIIIGYQQEVFENWTVGVRYINRKIKDGMDDFCSYQGFIDYAEDNGYDNFDYHSLASCMFVNPGRDLTFAVDWNDDGNLQVTTMPAEYFGLPKYKREYNALEVFWEKAFNDGYYLQGSYTWAKSEGNAEGYVNSTLEQADPGLTQDFDHFRFMEGADGPLPNDRRHTFKLFGAYQLNDEVTLSASLLVQSGRPVNCNGYVNTDGLSDVDAGNLDGYGPSAFSCLDDNGVRQLAPRGSFGRTPWLYNVDMGIGYNPEAVEGLTLRMDITNVFNIDGVLQYDETGDFTRTEQNPDFGVPVSWQAPRSVRLTARYSF